MKKPFHPTVTLMRIIILHIDLLREFFPHNTIVFRVNSILIIFIFRLRVKKPSHPTATLIEVVVLHVALLHPSTALRPDM